MKTAILIILSIILFASNPCCCLSCWFCNPKDENFYDAECTQEFAQVPICPNETTDLPMGLSKQDCPTMDDLYSSTTFSIPHNGYPLNLTTRVCSTWNTEVGMNGFAGSWASGVSDCIKRGIGNKNIIEVAVCLCYYDLCIEYTNITPVQNQQMKTNDSTKNLSKSEELEREAETLEEGANKIQETIQKLKDDPRMKKYQL